MTFSTIKKLLSYLTVVCGISLIALPCEAGQVQPSMSSLSPACKLNCTNDMCRQALPSCTDCCQKKHKKNMGKLNYCINKCQSKYKPGHPGR